jgi:hypothetical protein
LRNKNVLAEQKLLGFTVKRADLYRVAQVSEAFSSNVLLVSPQNGNFTVKIARRNITA